MRIYFLILAPTLASCIAPTAPNLGQSSTTQAANVFTLDSDTYTLSAGVSNDWTACLSYGWDVCALAGLSWDGAIGCPSQSTWIRNVGAYPITLGDSRSSNTYTRDQLHLLTAADEVLQPGDELWLTCNYDYSIHGPGGWYERRAPRPVAHPSTSSRALNSAFQPSATTAVFGYYSVSIASTISLSGGAAGRVRLLSDASNPPTTIRAEVDGGITGTAVAGLSMTSTSGGELSYLVPAGDYVLLETAATTGSPTFTLTAATEVTER